jgi:hypothetical protein
MKRMLLILPLIAGCGSDEDVVQVQDNVLPQPEQKIETPQNSQGVVYSAPNNATGGTVAPTPVFNMPTSPEINIPTQTMPAGMQPVAIPPLEEMLAEILESPPDSQRVKDFRTRLSSKYGTGGGLPVLPKAEYYDSDDKWVKAFDSRDIIVRFVVDELLRLECERAGMDRVPVNANHVVLGGTSNYKAIPGYESMAPDVLRQEVIERMATPQGDLKRGHMSPAMKQVYTTVISKYPGEVEKIRRRYVEVWKKHYTPRPTR